MKKIFLAFVLLCTLISSSIRAAEKEHEVLLRMNYLSLKNASIITVALDTLPGIKNIEAYYELNALIIEHDDRINDEELVKFINGLNLNSPAEKIHSKDIPIIRNKYQVTQLRKTD